MGHDADEQGRATAVNDFLEKFKDTKESPTLPLYDVCPVCGAKIRFSKIMKGSGQLRYVFFLYCSKCGFNHAIKGAVTKRGRVYDRVPFTDAEMDELKGAVIELDGTVMLWKKDKYGRRVPVHTG
jgi:hypothetical protein